MSTELKPAMQTVFRFVGANIPTHSFVCTLGDSFGVHRNAVHTNQYNTYMRLNEALENKNLLEEPLRKCACTTEFAHPITARSWHMR